MRSAALFLLLTLVTACKPAATSAHPDEAAVRSFLERYFSTWSAQDMVGYGECFSNEARVFYAEKSGALTSQGKIDFLHGQEMAHTKSTEKMTEVPNVMAISGDSRIAQAGVKWTLTKGSTSETGLDYFTLRKGDDGWKIVSLVFYQH